MAAKKKFPTSQKKHGVQKSISRQLAELGISPKSVVLYFGIPFVLSLLFGLFISSPEPVFSSSLSDWRDTGFAFKHGEFEIFYQDIVKRKALKKGPPLLILHGFPTSSYDWKKVVFELTGYFGRVIAVDMLGFGFSDKPVSHNYTVLEQAIIHEKILESHGIKEAHLLAHDLGDTVAQEMLARFIDRKKNKERGLNIASLCLSNGGILPETHRPRFVQKLLRTPVLGAISARLMNFLAFSRSFAAVFGDNTQPTYRELWEFWTIIRHNSGHLSTPGLLKYIDERNHFRDRWIGALQNTDVPLHLIYGAKDPINQDDSLQLYRKLMPQSTVTVLKDAGHYPQWEDPQGFLQGYQEFLHRIGVTER